MTRFHTIIESSTTNGERNRAMDQTTFLAKMEEALRAAPGSIRMTDQFQDLEGWDSIGALSVIAVVDEQYGVTLDAGALLACRTVADLAALLNDCLTKAA
jgi:acyl carrier protein